MFLQSAICNYGVWPIPETAAGESLDQGSPKWVATIALDVGSQA